MDTDLTDHEIILRLRSGDASGLAVVLNSHWSLLVSYVLSLGVDTDTAEDVSQQAFVRLWDRRNELRLEGSIRGLLYRIARNLCFDVGRKKRALERALSRSTHTSRAVSPHAGLEADELRSIIERAVNSLPKRRREVFVLVRYNGLSHREVAEVLDLAPQTVANHLGMALAELRVSLAPYLPDYLADSDAAAAEIRQPRAAVGLSQ